MCSREFELTFRCESVTWWGLFFSRIATDLMKELPLIRKITITLVKEEMFSTVSAIAEGEGDMGLVTPPACLTMAYRGVGPYRKSIKNLRAIGSFPHDDRIMWAVPADSGINSIGDMPNKPLRLVIPGQEFPVRFLVEKVLDAYGTSLDVLKSHGWQIFEENQCLKIPLPVIQGKADALVHEGRKTPAWIQLTQSRLMKFLPIRADVLQKLETEYGFRRAILTKEMLRGVQDDVPCVDCSDWTMFVRDDMPDEAVYLVTKMFVERRTDFFEVYFRSLPVEKSELVYPMDPERVWRNIGEIPLHPAAERYYKENGYMERESANFR